MIFVDLLQHLQVLLVMQIAFFLLLLPLCLFLSELTDPVFPVLGVAAEDALVKDLARVLVIQLQGVHARAAVPMESLGAVAALHSCTLGLATEACELFLVHKVLQSLANVDPLLSLDAEA